ncbi:TonB family protein [Acinetobacter guillouiae]|uniref:TonB family protein n=1 Tax=Acinetobacter guillouiae TaxID=106649 RepID=UPI003AF5A2AE
MDDIKMVIKRIYLLGLLLLTIEGWAEVIPNTTSTESLPDVGVMQTLSTNNTPIKYIKRPKITYPKNLSDFGNRGKVLLKVLITETGRVSEVEVLDSPHPDLERAAVQAVMGALFEPEKINGKPQSGFVKIPIEFSVSAGLSNGVDPFRIPAASKNLPADLQYDVAPQIRIAAPLVYPYELLKSKTTGKAKVYVVIDPDGNVRQANVLSASEPSFGLAAKASLQSWKFYPAKKDGKHSWSVITKEQNFNQFNRDTSNSHSTTQILADLERGKTKIYELKDLDSIPKPLYAPHPEMPIGSDKSQKSKVMLEFYLDQDGMVILPKIVSGNNDEFSWLALTAVKRWQFDIPKVNGKAVVARLRLPIQFD